MKKRSDSLHGKEPSIKEQQLAQKVFNNFGGVTLGDYHDLYLKTDFAFLAEIFENFRQRYYDTYGMDSAQSFTASDLAVQKRLEVCRPSIDLSPDRDHLDLTE